MADSGVDIWVKLCELPRPSRLVDFPRPGPNGEKYQVAMWCLTQEEQMQCAANAEKFTRRIIKDVPKNDDARRGYDDIYANAAAIEILFHVCRKPGDLGSPFFPAVESIRQKMTTDEIAVLFTEYLTVQSELGPIVAKMSKEEVDALVLRITESGQRFPLDFLSQEALKDLVLSLALRLRPSLTDTSSAGSQPEGGASAS